MHAGEGMPYLHTAIIACGGDAFSVGRPGHVKYSIAMPIIGIDMIASSSIPHLHGMISAGRGDALAIRRPCDSAYVIRMATVHVMIRGADKMYYEGCVGSDIRK